MDAGCWGGGHCRELSSRTEPLPREVFQESRDAVFGPVRPSSYRSFSKPRSPRVFGHGEGRRRDFEMVAVAVVAVVAVGPDDQS